MGKIVAMLALIFCGSSIASDYGTWGKISKLSFVTAIIVLNSMEAAAEDGTGTPFGIIVDDKWNFWTTNTQSILSIIGTLTLAVNFASAYYYYRHGQHDLSATLQNRIDDFETKKIRLRKKRTDSMPESSSEDPEEVVVR